MIKDYQIRKRKIDILDRKYDGTSYRIIEEFVISDGLARADIAVVNGHLHGYEIKSDLDTLERLENQIIQYDATFEKNTIIVGKKFKDSIQDYVPNHWGIELAYENKFGNVTINTIRKSRKNPNINRKAIYSFLWNAELKSLLIEKNVKGISTLKKKFLCELVDSCVGDKELLNFARMTLKTRDEWRMS